MSYLRHVYKDPDGKRDDDYITPREAYLDIKPYVPPGVRVIYDPFYCDGTSKHYMQEVFGSDIKVLHFKGRNAFSHVPDRSTFDLIVTNPPFTKKWEVMHYLMALDKPFMCLLPVTLVSTKQFRQLPNYDQIKLVVTSGRYKFERPGGERLSGAWYDVYWYCYKVSLGGSSSEQNLVYVP